MDDCGSVEFFFNVLDVVAQRIMEVVIRIDDGYRLNGLLEGNLSLFSQSTSKVNDILHS